jgi:transposase-like protein
METTVTLTALRKRWAEQLEERPACPHGCPGRVWHNGHRLRSATIREDEQSVFVPEAPERQKRCSVCHASWTHRPEGITSRAHYQPCVVSHALGELGRDAGATTSTLAGEIGCVPSTLRRWAARVAALAEPAALASAIVEQAGEPVLPAVPTELASPQRSARLRALFVRALAVLVLLEALASLRGLAPPALAHAPKLLPANAAGLGFVGDPPRPA